MEVGKGLGYLLAFAAGVVVVKNWAKLRGFVGDVCDKSAALVGFEKEAAE